MSRQTIGDVVSVTLIVAVMVSFLTIWNDYLWAAVAASLLVPIGWTIWRRHRGLKPPMHMPAQALYAGLFIAGCVLTSLGVR